MGDSDLVLLLSAFRAALLRLTARRATADEARSLAEDDTSSLLAFEDDR